jgi:hypothetical protein
MINASLILCFAYFFIGAGENDNKSSYEGTLSLHIGKTEFILEKKSGNDAIR